MPSLSLGGHDGAFAAGLLAAMGAVATRGRPVLLVRLRHAACRRRWMRCGRPPFPSPPAWSWLPAPEGARAALDLRYVAEPAPADAPAEGLDALAAGNPAARALPLLRALAARRAALVRLPLLEDAHLEIRVTPC